MKKIIACFAAVVLFAACQESLEERAAREALAYTEKNCPAQLSEYVVIDSMTFDAATRTICYDYRLMGVMDTTVNDTVAMRKQLGDGIKNATSMKSYKDAGFNFRYVYRSQKSPEEVLFEATFTKEDY